MEAKLLEKIQKLLALAEHNTQEHEIAAAMAKVNSLLREHGLSMSDVEAFAAENGADAKAGPKVEPVVEDTVHEESRVYSYINALGDAVRRLCNCDWLLHETAELMPSGKMKNRARYIFIGCETDVAVAKAMVAYLKAAMVRFADEAVAALPGHYDRGEKRIFRTNFYQGFARRVHQRCSEIRNREEEQERLAKQGKLPAGETTEHLPAIVNWGLVKQAKADAVEAYKADKYPRLQKRASRASNRFDMTGYAHGMAAGNRVDLGRRNRID